MLPLYSTFQAGSGKVNLVQRCAVHVVTHIEKEDLEHKGEEDVSRLPHDADLDRLLDLQGDSEQHLG